MNRVVEMPVGWSRGSPVLILGLCAAFAIAAGPVRGGPVFESALGEAAAAGDWEEVAAPNAVFKGSRAAGNAKEPAATIEAGAVVSRPFPVTPFHYYRITCRARSAARALWAALPLTADGREIAADVYDAIDPAPAWQERSFIVRAHADAATMRVRLQPDAAPLSVRGVSVEEVSAEAAAAWCDEVAAQCPLLDFAPAADRWSRLPRTMQRLRDGGPLRVVMLGDSICNDTSNSLFETRLARLYPQARIEVVTSVRGATGCWWYKDESRVKDFVLAYAPNLVVIAGISHGFDPESIRTVIRQVREGCDAEMLVTTGAVTPPSYLKQLFLRTNAKTRTPTELMDAMESFTPRLRRVCDDEKAEFFDTRRAWDDWMLRTAAGFELVSRDAIHANSRGKQILGRTLVRFFQPKERD